MCKHEKNLDKSFINSWFCKFTGKKCTGYDKCDKYKEKKSKLMLDK